MSHMARVEFDLLKGSLAEAKVVHSLARKIWFEHYSKYYPPKLLEIGVELYSAPEVVLKQIEEGYLYYFLKANDARAGFLAFKAYEEKQHLYLGKLYISREFRGLGIGGKAISFAEDFAREKGMKAIQLQCSEANQEARKVYDRRGFRVIKRFVEHIAGDVSSELILEKPL